MSDIFWNITVSHFLVLAAVLFGIGVIGVLVRRNALIIMMAIELMLNAANITLIAFARQHGNHEGHAMAFIVIAVAAAEAAVGLAILVAVFRNRHHANVDDLTSLKH